MRVDLKKDLHLIYGQNAIGKSYAAYCIYIILKNFKSKNFSNIYYRGDSLTPGFEKAFEPVFKKAHATLGVQVDINNLFKKILNELFDNLLATEIKNAFLNSFSALSNLKNQYSNKNYSITLDIEDDSSVVINSDNDGNPFFTVNISHGDLSLVEKDTKTTKYSFLIDKKKHFALSDKKEFLKKLNYFFVRTAISLMNEIGDGVKDIYYLPASRSGLYQALNSFTPILAELTQSRFFLNKKTFQLPALPEPLSDYFLDLSTLNKKNLNKELLPIVDEIEREILHGEVSYNQETNKIIFTPHDLKLELDVSQSSSMVAEMSPIVLYLRHILNHKFQGDKNLRLFYPGDYYYDTRRRSKGFDILFIEEPEAHLHPEIQVKLMSIFAKLSKTGLKIFITSHSNYMFYQVNNLIIGQDVKYSSIASYQLVKSNQGSVVNPDMTVTKNGIPDDNFEDTIRRLYEERLNLES